jgi:hypothetical protein
MVVALRTLALSPWCPMQCSNSELPLKQNRELSVIQILQILLITGNYHRSLLYIIIYNKISSVPSFISFCLSGRCHEITRNTTVHKANHITCDV